ncbi:hypothetical protein SLE2022_258950 [Rubroshorea leprosula]
MTSRETLEIETTETGESFGFDDDGRPKRTGTWLTATAHIITTVIGSGVLSLAWSVAQLGWIGGTIALIAFALITWFASSLLADCYRDPVTGKRNHGYKEAVKSVLGELQFKFCAVVQYVTLLAISIGYTITPAISMAAMIRSYCFHKEGHDAGCHVSNNKFIIIFGAIQLFLSQIPDFHQLAGLSTIAATMSFAYSTIGLCLTIAKIAEGKHVTTSITGLIVGVDVTSSEKLWNCLVAIGNIAVAYTFSVILIEIQDTLRSNPPENKVMKKAAAVGISITTIFYMSCGLLGYAAFGNNAPGNFLTGFRFYEPFWLIILGNLFVIIHLVGAYQVISQPIFKLVEDWCNNRWPESSLLREGNPIKIPLLGVYRFNMLRLVWRSVYVTFVTLVSMLFPFFNNILGLIGVSFWPLTVYFPVEMHISRLKIQKFSFKWIGLQALSVFCLIISLLVAAGSIEGIIRDLGTFKILNSVS